MIKNSRAILIYRLEDAKAALVAAHTLNCSVTIVTAPEGAGQGGALWFKALIDQARAPYPDLEVTALLDCGRNPGFVLGALRMGLKHVIIDPAVPSFPALAEIAALQGATLWPARPMQCLDLRDRKDAVELCKKWLMSH